MKHLGEVALFTDDIVGMSAFYRGPLGGAVAEWLGGAIFGFLVGPRDYRWGRSAYLRDPDGRLVELAHS